MSHSAGQSGAAGHDQMMSALFASLIMQNTNMALIFLGQAPNPQTGQTTQDLDHARLFIDQLEMLAVKTKGNLDKLEESLLKQSLTSLRMAFVEAVGHPQPAPPSGTPTAPSGTAAAPPTDEQETPVTEPAPPCGTPPATPAEEQETPVIEPEPPIQGAAESESRKKFSKKY
jgi:hypothetical protein